MTQAQTPSIEFTLEQFNAVIQSIATAQARATKQIGVALLGALYFANVKQDAGAANALVKCLRKSTKQTGIVALLEKHGKLAYIKADKKFAFFDAKTPEWNAESVKALRVVCASWEDFKPEAAKVEEFDLFTALQNQIKKAEKLAGENVKVNGMAQIEKIKAMLGELAGADLLN